MKIYFHRGSVENRFPQAVLLANRAYRNIFLENTKSAFKNRKKRFNPRECPLANRKSRIFSRNLLYHSTYHSLVSIVEFSSPYIILNEHTLIV